MRKILNLVKKKTPTSFTTYGYYVRLVGVLGLINCQSREQYNFVFLPSVL